MVTVVRTLVVRALTWAMIIGLGAIVYAVITPKPHPKTAHRHDDGLIYFDCTKPPMSAEEAARPWKRDVRRKPYRWRMQAVAVDY